MANWASSEGVRMSAGFEIEHWKQVSGPHPVAGHLDEMVRFVGTVVGDALGPGRALDDIHPAEVIGARVQAGVRCVGDVLDEVRIVVAHRERVGGRIVVGVALIVIAGGPASRGTDESERFAVDVVDRVPGVLVEVALPVGDVDAGDAINGGGGAAAMRIANDAALNVVTTFATENETSRGPSAVSQSPKRSFDNTLKNRQGIQMRQFFWVGSGFPPSAGT